MKYKVILRTMIVWGGSRPNQINWIRESEEFMYHAKAKKMKDAFDKEQPLEIIRMEEGKQYPAQLISWQLINEEDYNKIKGE